MSVCTTAVARSTNTKLYIPSMYILNSIPHFKGLGMRIAHEIRKNLSTVTIKFMGGSNFYETYVTSRILKQFSKLCFNSDF